MLVDWSANFCCCHLTGSQVQQFQNENIAVPVKFELWVIKKMFCVH